jgi:short-subunit dehydrogenase
MKPKLKPLAEQVIVITGASSGIGLVTARKAAAAGAAVLLVSRDETALARIAAELGDRASYAVADVRDRAAVESAAAAAIARWGRIDTWVNNAGVTIYAALVDTPEDEHRRLIETNYFGCVNGCLAAIPHLAESRGALITVASIVADMPSPIMGAYAASKAAVQSYVESLRIELEAAGTPVSVTLVKPSGIDTPIADHAANHVGGHGLIPPPVYAPELVAGAILDAAVTPRRQITVGGGGRAQALFAEHFPRVFERLAPIAATTFIDPARTQPRPSNLFAPARPVRERSDVNTGRPVSLYTAAARRPKLVKGVAIAGVVAGILALSGSSRRNES